MANASLSNQFILQKYRDVIEVLVNAMHSGPIWPYLGI